MDTVLRNLVFFTFCTQCAFSSEDVKFSNRISIDKNVQLSWNVENGTITFEVEYSVVNQTIYWVGFGLSSTGSMPGSDLALCFWENGVPQFTDRHLPGERCESVVDPKQDYILLKAEHNSTNAVLRMKRKLDTCDENDYAIMDDTAYVLYAIGTYKNCGKPPRISNISISHHQIRNAAPVVFLGSTQEPINITDNVKIWDMLMGNITVPAKETTYWCKYFKLPDYASKKKHNYIGYKVLISESMRNYVHHMMLFQCKGDTADYERKIKEPGYDCTNRDTLSLNSNCIPPLAGWGVGSEGHTLPPKVGLVLGEEYGEFSYFIVQIHYANFDTKSGLIDNSGFRLYLTDVLRPIEGGTFQINNFHTFNMVIPPHQTSFLVTGFCPPECTEAALPPTGIKVFSIWLHAHTRAKKIRVRHFRNDTELPPVASDNNYYFDLQLFRQLSTEVTILPGDFLFTECEYNTVDDDVATLGGVQTSDEMCSTLLEYYPRINFSRCISGAIESDFLRYFRIDSVYPNGTIQSPNHLAGKPMTKYLKEDYKWGQNQTQFDEIQQIQKGPKDGFCAADKAVKIKTFQASYPGPSRWNPERSTCKNITQL